MNIPIILIAIAAALLGLMAGVLMANRQKNALKTQCKLLEQEKQAALRQAEEMAAAARSQCEALMQQKENAHQAMMQALRESHAHDLESQQAQCDQIVKNAMAQMKLATDEMLKARQKEFSEASSTNLSHIVNPLKESIAQMKEAMSQNAERNSEMNTSIKVNLERMISQSEAAQRSAEELTHALKRNTKIQGDWGELVLTELLTSQGLTEGIHFETQSVIRDDDGKTIKPDVGRNMRPDVVLHLDSQRDVIIDSKVSLTSYIEAMNTDSEELRQQYLQEHVKSLRHQVELLAKKDYSQYHTRSRIDFVIMFVPHSPALLAATNIAPQLWREAMDKKVFIADEQTLFAALKIIRLTWTQIEQEENHQKLYDLANTMLDRVGAFLQSYEKIGSSIRDAQNAFNDGLRKLEDHGQSIPTTARQMIQLGAHSTKPKSKIPNKYLDEKQVLR